MTAATATEAAARAVAARATAVAARARAAAAWARAAAAWATVAAATGTAAAAATRAETHWGASSERLQNPGRYRRGLSPTPERASRPARAAMALSKLSGDEQCIIFRQLCNPLDPGVAVAFGSASSELWTLTQAERQQLRADYEVAAALCVKVGMRSFKELREAKMVGWSIRPSCTIINGLLYYNGLSAADLALLGTLGSVLPALERLHLHRAGPEGLERLAERLGAGALPAVTLLQLSGMHVGDAGASALAAALGRGALPRLKILTLTSAAIGDAGLLALAPALRLQPALAHLDLSHNPFGDEGLAALVTPPPPPPPPAGAPPPTGLLTKLKRLYLSRTQVTDAGCAALAAALDRGVLPALKTLELQGTPASAAAKTAVRAANAARDRRRVC